MADCLEFLTEHPGSNVRVLTTGAAEEQELVNQALAGQDYVDAGTGPIGCTIATHVGVDAIAISYCPATNLPIRATHTTCGEIGTVFGLSAANQSLFHRNLEIGNQPCGP